MSRHSHNNGADRGHEQIAEPASELDIQQTGQLAADKRPRYADQKIGKKAVIAGGHLFCDPASNDADYQHA
jgi:hypothetical protein